MDNLYSALKNHANVKDEKNNSTPYQNFYFKSKKKKNTTPTNLHRIFNYMWKA